MAQLKRLRLKLFPGSHTLPLVLAASHGCFERQGLEVEMLFTVNSQELRDDLGEGRVELAQAAVDNAVAMAELAGHDVVIVTGGDSGMSELFVQPDVPSVAALKGQTVIVDAPNTAYALQLKKILLLGGLKAGDYTLLPVGGTSFRLKAMRENRDYKASMLNPPFSVEGAAAGLKSLGKATDFIGPYQAQGTFVLRKWALANGEILERYIAAVVQATRWVLDSANKAAAVSLLAERNKLDGRLAERTWELMSDPKSGLAPDARFDPEGFRNVLALRAEIEGSWGGQPPAPERYYDLSYYEKALKRLR